ncbi:hypothetical protein [Psychrobacter phenylpyruvicus]|uniref:Uncharacterized protein n=1 Tax=Psychrobacter phenylpyruvicus TaxID=29432 RepID=A0A379LH67_9GAMM|nr:hypothetical protein [Psychrobacter phenylpyruvicus]SUD89801.1 Uncharacterised protein [Psychrobacter phenylpyruvicus]
MLKLMLANLISLGMFLLSFGIQSSGGLYTHSYIIDNDIYSLSDLQGAGGNDFVLLIIGSGALFLLLTFINALYILKPVIKSILSLIAIIISLWFFGLMETASFINISYATILFGDNIIFSIWLSLFILLNILVFSNILISIKNKLSKSRVLN